MIPNKHLGGIMKRLHQPHLSEKERKTLQAWMQQRNIGWKRERARIILAAHQGLQPREIAVFLGRCLNTVSRWWLRFLEHGINGLLDLPRSGRKRRLTEQQELESIAFLEQSPRDFGLESDKWTPINWHSVIEERFCVSLSTRTSRRLRKKYKVRWIRSKRWLRSGDPDYKQKRDEILEARACAEALEDMELLYLDECGPIGVRPHYGLQLATENAPKHEIPDHFEVKGDVRLYGSYAWVTNEVKVWECPVDTFNGEQTIDFLKWLAPQYKGKDWLFVVWDNASWHISRQVQDWIMDFNETAKSKGLPRLDTLQLPSKAPWLNPIEPVWRGMREQAINAVDWVCKQKLTETIMSYFERRNAKYKGTKRRKRKRSKRYESRQNVLRVMADS
jgi:transposase